MATLQYCVLSISHETKRRCEHFCELSAWYPILGNRCSQQLTDLVRRISEVWPIAVTHSEFTRFATKGINTNDKPEIPVKCKTLVYSYQYYIPFQICFKQKLIFFLFVTTLKVSIYLVFRKRYDLLCDLSMYFRYSPKKSPLNPGFHLIVLWTCFNMTTYDKPWHTTNTTQTHHI